MNIPAASAINLPTLRKISLSMINEYRTDASPAVSASVSKNEIGLKASKKNTLPIPEVTTIKTSAACPGKRGFYTDFSDQLFFHIDTLQQQ